MAWYNDLIGAATDLGKGAGDVYQAFTGNSSSDEAAYLKGANDVLRQQAEQNRDDGIIKIGDVEISTTSILWIIGGTLGLLAVGLGVKKLM